MKRCTCDLVEHNGDINNRVGGDSIEVSISYSMGLAQGDDENTMNCLSWVYENSEIRFLKENTVAGLIGVICQLEYYSLKFHCHLHYHEVMILKKSLLSFQSLFIFCAELASNMRETKAKGYSAEDEAAALLYLWFNVCKPHTDVSNVSCTFWKEIAISVRTLTLMELCIVNVFL